MSIQILYQADLCLDGIAASTEFMRVKLTLNGSPKDKTAFMDTARSFLPSLYDAVAEGDFYYQMGSGFTANKLESVTAGPTPGVFVPMVVALGADQVVGNLVSIFKAANVKNEPGATDGEVLKGSLLTAAADRNVQATRLIRALNAITGTSGTGTAINLGALTATQAMYAALNVVATTGGASGTVFSIISSASSGLPAPTTRITFTTGTSQTAGEWQSAAGAVTDTWWAFKWASYTGTGCTVSCAAGIQ